MSVNILDILKDLIKIDTRNPPGYTGNAVEYIQNIFSSYNCHVIEKNGKENIVIEISRGKPEIMFNSHLDTVPASDLMLNPIIVNGKLYGRGACDAKGCVSAIISAFYGYESYECGKGIYLSFTADEEIGGKLGLDLVLEKYNPDYIIIGEPTGSDRVGIAQARVISADIVVSGKSGHTAIQDVKEGAIYKASKFIISAVEFFSSLRGNMDYLNEIKRELGVDIEIRGSGEAVFNPSIIKGGNKRNVVSDRCVIKADIRVMPWIEIDMLREFFRKFEGVEIIVEGHLEPYGFGLDGVEKNKDLKLFNALKNAMKKCTAVVSLGVGDIRHARKRGIPAFYLGARGGEIHGNGEFVYINDLYRCVNIYRKIVELI